MAYKYQKDQLFIMGQIYTSLLHILNKNGHDPYPFSQITPFKALVIVIPQAMRIGIPQKLNAEIAKLMDDLESEDIDEMMKTPVPMDMRQHWCVGCLKYEELTKLHKIAQFRKKRGMTQKQLAEKIGVEQKDISRWENFVCSPNAENLKKLAEALDCKVDYLI